MKNLLKKPFTALLAIGASIGMLVSGYALANNHCCEGGNKPCCVEKAPCCKNAE